MSKRRIAFTKMHGLGNDFMVVDATMHPLDTKHLAIPQLSDRHIGIGFDQLLIIEPSTRADFFCRIFNHDGSEAEQCGNGLRCIARYVSEQGLLIGDTLKIETKSGIFPIKINSMGSVSVTLPPPDSKLAPVQLKLNTIQNHINLDTLSLGNPHAILKVEAVETAPVELLGPEISTHPHFTCGTNVGFMEVMHRDHIRLRTFERGTGETHACGSNACAAAIIGIRNGWLATRVTVQFRLGSLVIEWEGEGQPVRMTGPAATVYKGEYLY